MNPIETFHKTVRVNHFGKARTPPAATRFRAEPRWHEFLFLISLLGLYTQYHIYSGNQILLPFAIPNLIGITIFLTRAYPSQSRGLGTNLLLLSLFAIFYLIVAITEDHFGRSAERFVQLIVSLYAGYGLCHLVIQFHRDRLQKILLSLAFGILAIAFCEVFLGFYRVMVEINSYLYSWRPQGFYLSTMRDIAIWGTVRPLVFSTEPSLVGIWGITFMVGATMISDVNDRMRHVRLLLYAVALFAVARTPSVLTILAFYYLAKLVTDRNAILVAPAAACGTIIGSFLILILGLPEFLTDYMRGTSFFARIQAPFLTMLEVFRTAPIFGLGLGNERELSQAIFGVWEHGSMLSASRTYVEAFGVTGMLTNNLFWNWIFFGVVGGLTFLLIALHLLRQLGRISLAMLLLPGAGVWMTIGGFIDLRSWFFIFFFAGCLAVATRSQKNEC